MTPTVVIGLDVADLTELELRQEVLKLRRRVQKLTALLRLALALRRTSRFASQERRSSHCPFLTYMTAAPPGRAIKVIGKLSRPWRVTVRPAMIPTAAPAVTSLR